MTTAARVAAIQKGLRGGHTDPNRCVCAEKEPVYRDGGDTPHRHYEEPPFPCARCKCKAYVPAVPAVSAEPAGVPPADELTIRRKEAAESYLDEFLADPQNRRVFEEERAAYDKPDPGLRERVAKVLRRMSGESRATVESMLPDADAVLAAIGPVQPDARAVGMIKTRIAAWEEGAKSPAADRRDHALVLKVLRGLLRDLASLDAPKVSPPQPKE